MSDEQLAAEPLSPLAERVDEVLARVGYELDAAIDAIDAAVPGFGGLFDPNTSTAALRTALDEVLASDLDRPPIVAADAEAFVLYVDGSSRGNPGPAGAGAVILDAD